MGTDNIISAVMHADELNTALSEEYEYVENLKQEYYKKLENMTKDKRLQYFRDNIAIENKK